MTTRFKDIYDMYYLQPRIKRDRVKKLLESCIYADNRIRESNSLEVSKRLIKIFDNRQFMDGLRNPMSAWLDADPSAIVESLVNFLGNL